MNVEKKPVHVSTGFFSVSVKRTFFPFSVFVRKTFIQTLLFLPQPDRAWKDHRRNDAVACRIHQKTINL